MNWRCVRSHYWARMATVPADWCLRCEKVRPDKQRVEARRQRLLDLR